MHQFTPDSRISFGIFRTFSFVKYPRLARNPKFTPHTGSPENSGLPLNFGLISHCEMSNPNFGRSAPNAPFLNPA